MSTYFYEKITDVLKNENVVLVSNNMTGNWIKIPKVCYEVIKDATNKKIPLEETIDLFVDEDKEYYKKVLKNLKNLGVISEELLEKINYRFVPQISFAITNRCNLHCEYCCTDSHIKEIDKLSLDDLKMIVDKIIMLKPQNLCISGGEPMLRNDFFEFISYIKSIYSGKLILSTNATLINDRNVDFLRQNFFAIEISLDGYNEETCSTVRGKGVFEHVVNVVQLLKSKDFDRISLSMVLGKHNKHWKSKFEELNKDLETNCSIRYFCGLGRGTQECEKYLEDGSLIYIPKDAYDIDKGIISNCCNAGNSQLFVDSEGNLKMCPNLSDEEFILCNMENFDEDTIDRIYKSDFEAYKNFEKLKPKNRDYCKECDINLFCGTCPAHVNIIKDDENALKNYCDFHKKHLRPQIW